MDLSTYVDTLRHELAVAARSAGPDAEALAERLTAPLESATRLVLQEAVSDAAQEISRDLAPGSVDVRLRGRDLGFVVDRGPRDRAAPSPLTRPAGRRPRPPHRLRPPTAPRTPAPAPASRRVTPAPLGSRSACPSPSRRRWRRRPSAKASRQRLPRPDSRRGPAARNRDRRPGLASVRQPAERVGPVTGPQDAPRDPPRDTPQDARPGAASAAADDTHTFVVDAPVSLAVSLEFGTVRVHAQDTGTVTARIWPAARPDGSTSRPPNGRRCTSPTTRWRSAFPVPPGGSSAAPARWTSTSSSPPGRRCGSTRATPRWRSPARSTCVP